MVTNVNLQISNVLLGISANGIGLGDVAVPKCSIELQMFKLNTKCQ